LRVRNGVKNRVSKRKTMENHVLLIGTGKKRGSIGKPTIKPYRIFGHSGSDGRVGRVGRVG